MRISDWSSDVCSSDLVVEAAAVPLSPAARRIVTARPDLLVEALAGGDDYELVFTARPEDVVEVAQAGRALGLEVAAIGRIVARRGVELRASAGRPVHTARTGFMHGCRLTGSSPAPYLVLRITRILLFVTALILLLAGGGGAFVYFREAGAATEPQAAIDAVPAPGIFVPLDTISLPVFRDGRVRRLIAFTIVVEVAPGQDHERVSAQIPRFEDRKSTRLTYSP